MLRVLPLTFKPVHNFICCKTGLLRVVKRATSLSLFNSFCSIVIRWMTSSVLFRRCPPNKHYTSYNGQPNWEILVIAIIDLLISYSWFIFLLVNTVKNLRASKNLKPAGLLPLACAKVPFVQFFTFKRINFAVEDSRILQLSHIEWS